MALTGERARLLPEHLRQCMAEAERGHTPEEILAAEVALSTAPEARQPSLFSCTANRGVAPTGQPGPAGCGARNLRNPE